MEQRSAFLRGIASVLNAGGSALVDIYDAATSIKTKVVPGETGKLKAKLDEYEKKIERLYYQIGKEVAQGEYTGQTPAVAEAGIKLVAEYREKIEKIKQGIQIIEEKAATKAATERAGAKAEPAAHAGADAASGAAAAASPPAGVATEEGSADAAEALETSEVIAANAAEAAGPEAGEGPAIVHPEGAANISGQGETRPQELQPEAAAPGVPVAGESSPAPEMNRETPQLDTMLKSELLKMCADKGMNADQRMTKAAIIELITKGQG